MQSRIHDIWANGFGSSMKDDPVYTPSDCFETFPFSPAIYETELSTENEQLRVAGEAYYVFREALMIENNEGLTKTYNRFHDPDERSPKIIKLRELHAKMDRAVFEAYGWSDLSTTAKCEFLLDYEDEDDGQQTSRRKKPWRYRWPDAFRDEVLARLLELNAQRAKEEALAGKASQDANKKRKKAKMKPPDMPLFDREETNDTF